MEFLSQTYVALRGPTGAPQTPADTIARLSDRLSPATLLADRRAAVLVLKGLARDCKQDVGSRALEGLLKVLANDAEIDADIAKAVLEMLHILCDVEDTSTGNKELGYKHTDQLLADEQTTHILFTLLGDANFYTRFATLELLTTLLQNRRHRIQAYFLTAPTGTRSIISVLQDKREIIRNEGVAVLQNLISQSPDIQKVLAFEGAFETLFNIVTQEGGVEGGIVAQGALQCVDGLLRFNTSNQSYFRETTLPSLLCSLLLFPSSLQDHEPAPQDFALQFWDNQKLANANLTIGILGMIIGAKNNSAQDNVMIRCLVELALASNAPTRLKTTALHLLPYNINFPLSGIIVTPYVPVIDTNGEEWDRLEPASALDALVELALHGEYNGLDSEKRLKSGLELRIAASGVFENFVRKEEIKLAIVQAMVPLEEPDGSQQIPVTPLVVALSALPSAESILGPAYVSSIHIGTLLFSHLLRSSTRSKSLARRIIFPSIQQASPDFFVPADGAPSTTEESEDEQQSLLQTLSENLSLSLLSRSRADVSIREAREWDRLVIAHLCLLSQWLWEDPKSVRDFLDAGGLGVLVEPINQSSEFDTIVPGLCAFLLGICYEFNRDPGEINRTSIQAIIQRLGVDMLIGQMTRFREDDRVKNFGPDSVVLPYPTLTLQPMLKEDPGEEAEIWFDRAFIDFWKSNYYTVQRGFSAEPDQLASSSGQDAKTFMLVGSLRDVIGKQSTEIEELQRMLKKATVYENRVSILEKKEAHLSEQLMESEHKRKDMEKELEDLLVLLDEVSIKRRRDKGKLREAGLEVSADEADDDEVGDEEEE